MSTYIWQAFGEGEGYYAQEAIPVETPNGEADVLETDTNGDGDPDHFLVIGPDGLGYEEWDTDYDLSDGIEVVHGTDDWTYA